MLFCVISYMKIARTIFVCSFLGTASLHTREQAQRLIQETEIAMLHHQPVWLDFTGIDFMSRSFADEFLKLAALWKRDHQFDWLGFSPTLAKMLDMVAKSRSKQSNSSKEIPFVTVTDESVLYRFFEAV